MKKLNQIIIYILLIALMGLMMSCGTKRKVCIPCQSNNIQIQTIEDMNILKS